MHHDRALRRMHNARQEIADFDRRVLPFDSAAARSYGEIAAARRRKGQPISVFDGQIAAIARSRDARLATRDGGDFAGCGVTLIDPWAGAT